MTLQPLWAWAILGLVLLSIELLSGTFYILWFGIAALCVAVILVLFPDTPFAIQLLAFSLLSLTTLFIWKRKYHRQGPAPVIGQSRDGTIGTIGRITATVTPDEHGRITFNPAVMGSREWTAIADETIESGTRAEIIAVEGNYFRVRAVTE